MTQDAKTEWLSDLWSVHAQTRTSAMGVLSSPKDSSQFADEMVQEFSNRFTLIVTEPKAREAQS